MATSVSSNTTYMDVMSQQLHHLIPTVNIRLVLIVLQLLRTAFLLVQATVCCRLYNRSQAAEVVWTTKKMSCKMRTLVWLSNWASTKLCMTVFHSCNLIWNLIGVAHFLVAEATVWSRGSCHAISPTAWNKARHVSDWQHAICHCNCFSIMYVSSHNGTWF